MFDNIKYSALTQVIVSLALLSIVSLALGGCAARNAARLAQEKQFFEAQEDYMQSVKPVFQLKGRPGEDIVLTGVEELNIYDTSTFSFSTRPHDPRHPAWDVAANAVGPVLMLLGQTYQMRENRLIARENRIQWESIFSSIAGMDRSDSSTSITVGGNYGETDSSVWTNSGQLGDSDDSHIGDWTTNSGRIGSPYSPVDNSNVDNTNNSQTAPPNYPPSP